MHLQLSLTPPQFQLAPSSPPLALLSPLSPSQCSSPSPPLHLPAPISPHNLQWDLASPLINPPSRSPPWLIDLLGEFPLTTPRGHGTEKRNKKEEGNAEVYNKGRKPRKIWREKLLNVEVIFQPDFFPHQRHHTSALSTVTRGIFMVISNRDFQMRHPMAYNTIFFLFT